MPGATLTKLGESWVALRTQPAGFARSLQDQLKVGLFYLRTKRSVAETTATLDLFAGSIGL